MCSSLGALGVSSPLRGPPREQSSWLSSPRISLIHSPKCFSLKQFIYSLVPCKGLFQGIFLLIDCHYCYKKMKSLKNRNVTGEYKLKLYVSLCHQTDRMQYVCLLCFFFVLFALLLFKNASTFALYKNSQPNHGDS